MAEIDTIVFKCPQCGEKFHAVPNSWAIVDERIRKGEPITCECPVCGTMISMKPVNN